MSMSSDECSPPDIRLQDALVAFTGCIGHALPDICSYGLTYGESYFPFEPDEEDDCEDSDDCSQVWVRVMSVAPRQGEPIGFGGECALVLTAELEVGVLRCIEIPGEGEAYTSTEMMAAAFQGVTDMVKLHDAAMSCEVWEQIITGSWQPTGVGGGQYGGTWSFTVEIDW